MAGGSPKSRYRESPDKVLEREPSEARRIELRRGPMASALASARARCFDSGAASGRRPEPFSCATVGGGMFDGSLTVVLASVALPWIVIVLSVII